MEQLEQEFVSWVCKEKEFLLRVLPEGRLPVEKKGTLHYLVQRSRTQASLLGTANVVRITGDFKSNKLEDYVLTAARIAGVLSEITLEVTAQRYDLRSNTLDWVIIPGIVTITKPPNNVSLYYKSDTLGRKYIRVRPPSL